MESLNDPTLYFSKQCRQCKQRLGKLRCNVGEIKCIQCKEYFCDSCYKNHGPLPAKCHMCTMTGVFRCGGDFYNENTCNYCVYW